MNSASLGIVLGIMVLSAVGLVLLLLPRFTPRAPRWAEGFVPPRYRRRRAAAAQQAAPAAAHQLECPAEEEHRVPVAAGVTGFNGATAVGARSRLLDRRNAETSRGPAR